MLQAQPPWHTLSTTETLTRLNSGSAGLSADESRRRLLRDGPNRLPTARGESLFVLFWRQINNPIGWLLLAAGGVALALGKGSDALVVFAAAAVNALLGFVQEYRAGRAIAALSALVPESAIVLRDGEPQTIAADELVCGDVVMLQSGDKVPADLRLLQLHNLLVDEASLTGESLAATKETTPTPGETPLGDRRCLAYSGTMVVQGTAHGVVVATGAATELGRINTLLNQTERLETPLTRQLAQVSTGITIAVVIVVAILLVFGIWIKHVPFGDALLVAVSLAVAAIPEGLPATITIALAIGVRRMALRNAVVRHLPAVETLGATTVICSDKTGTLTRNEMTLQVAWVAGEEYRFSGIGYVPEGEIERDGLRLTVLPEELQNLLTIGILCNDAAVNGEGGDWQISGDPTEAALLVAAAKAGLAVADLRRAHPRLDVVPFESESKFMVTLNQRDGAPQLLLKGALETVLERCDVPEVERQWVVAAMETYARQGLRVLACAWQPHDGRAPAGDWLDGGFRFAGLFGLIDPPRSEAIDAIRRCHRAGITVKMITGDHPVTAEAIGRQLGILHAGQHACHGSALDRLDDTALRAVVTTTHIFARVAPEHKLRIVQALQAEGEVVAMTGDGVNDAPALKRADIGLAMGITGTAVSREAAKVVLVDDNFATIAAAVEEGRRVYDNLIKSLAFILPTNLGLACTLSVAMFFFPTVTIDGVEQLLLALSPSQTLWINLVASVTLSIPLAFEVVEPQAMERPPRSPTAPVFSPFLIVRLVTVAALMTGGACLLFLWEYHRFTEGGVPTLAGHRFALAEAQTICVTSIIFTQSFYLLNCRSLRASFFSQGSFSNPAIFVGIAVLLLLQACYVYLPPLQRLFGSAPLDGQGWLEALLVGALVLPVVSFEKWWRSR